jgi:hypothetical protein
MSLHLPPQSFRDGYRWMAAAQPEERPLPSRLPFGRDGRVHPMRAAYEFYPTPPEATRALLSVEQFDGSIWEPACGRGALSMVLEAAGHQVVSTDLIQRDYGAGGIDFLRETEPRAKHIVTNPPYGRGLGDAFVRHALELTSKTSGTVAMLLNLASLCHPSRHALWIENPPAAIYGLDELVCWPEGDPSQARRVTTLHRYCWVVWKPGHVGRPTFWWLAAASFRAQEGVLERFPF